MRERPILFSAPMVRAILDGRKTQTRRLYKARPCDAVDDQHGPLYSLPSPYGSPGDRLWVRETFGFHARGDETDWFGHSTRGYTEEQMRSAYNLTLRADWGPLQEGCFWRPAIFMPRWASRITLEISEVHVQRLQEIDDGDAKAEGVEPYTPPHGHISPDQRVPGPGFDRARLGDQPHRLPFADLWDGINGKRAAWASNPWVWVLSFERVPCP